MRRVVLVMVALVAMLGLGSVVPVQAEAAGGFRLLSAYRLQGYYEDGSVGLTEVRITVHVPSSYRVLGWRVSRQESGGGEERIENQTLVADVQLITSVAEPSPAFTLWIRTSSGRTVWSTRVASSVQSKPTELSIDHALAGTAVVGGMVHLSGTLTSSGRPLAGAQVRINRYRASTCRRCMALTESYGDPVTVRSDGRWSWSHRLDASSRLFVSYCTDFRDCPRPVYAAAAVQGGAVEAGWAPGLSVPTGLKAGKSAVMGVHVPGAPRGVPVSVQALRGSTWATIGRATVGPGSRASVPVVLSSAGTTTLRATAQAFEWQDDPAFTDVPRLTAGAGVSVSRVAIVGR